MKNFELFKSACNISLIHVRCTRRPCCREWSNMLHACSGGAHSLHNADKRRSQRLLAAMWRRGDEIWKRIKGGRAPGNIKVLSRVETHRCGRVKVKIKLAKKHRLVVHMCCSTELFSTLRAYLYVWLRWFGYLTCFAQQSLCDLWCHTVADCMLLQLGHCLEPNLTPLIA